MNRFAEVMDRLKERAASDRLMKTLEGLDVLRRLPDDGRKKKPRVRLPYSSDPRSFEERWK
jgi:hypothetical protein